MAKPPKQTISPQQQKLDRQMKTVGFSFSKRQKNESDKRPPRLSTYENNSCPHILMLDDQPSFLSVIEMAWKGSDYQKSFTLHTLTLGTQIKQPIDFVDWINRLETDIRERLFVFVDRNHSSFRPRGLLSQLKANPVTRYIPIAFMTAGEMQAEDIAEIISAGAQRILYNKRSNLYFLYECASILDQLRDGVENKKWNDLRSELSKDIEKPSFDNNGKYEFVGTDKFLRTHLNIDSWSLRSLDESGNLISIKSTQDYASNILDKVNKDTLPFLEAPLNNIDPIKIDSLSLEDLGKDFPMVENLKYYHLLATPLHYGDKVLGVLTLLRNPKSKSFREADIQAIAPISAILSFVVGQGQAQLRLQQRQEELLHFVTDVDQCSSPENILDKLLQILHKDIQRSDNQKSKTTSRLLDFSTGELKRQEISYGIVPKKIKLNIYSMTSTHADVVVSGKTVRYNDISAVGDGNYTNTVPGMRSCMTLPLLAPDKLRLGSINLEHQNKNFYTNADEIYAKSLCRVATKALFRLREDEFKLNLIDLISLLNQPNADVFPELYKLLYNYFGYARMLVLTPSSTLTSPWLVERVISEGKEQEKVQLERWQKHINNNWDNSFIQKIILNIEETKFFTNDVKINDNEMGIITQSLAVVRIHEKDKDIVDHALVLFFLVNDALNHEQRQLLKRFGLFFNTLIQHRQIELGYYIQAVAQEDNNAANQQRHTLTNSIGSFRGIVNSFRKNRIDQKQFFSEIDEAIYETSNILASYRYLLKESPEFEEVDLAKVWNNAVIRVGGNNKDERLTTKPLSNLKFITDTDLIEAIFLNLIQNAAEAGAKSIWMESNNEGDELILRIFDDGEGISQNNRPKLFRLGSTTKSSGTGFGLHYCRNTIQKLGGEIYLQPENSHTCFILHLPKRSQ